MNCLEAWSDVSAVLGNADARIKWRLSQTRYFRRGLEILECTQRLHPHMLPPLRHQILGALH
jgi:hypothetical protein